MAKPRIVKDYEKLNDDVQNQIKFVYPKGFSQHLVSFTNRDGEQKFGLPFETDEYYYLIRMSASKAVDLVDEDDDFDDDGHLKDSVKVEFGERFKDMDFTDHNANSDNDLGDDEEHDPYADRDKDDGEDDEDDEEENF